MNWLNFLWAALGSLGMLVIVQAPRRSWPIAGLIAGLGYVLYDGLTALGLTAPLPVFLGCLAGCLLAQWAARRTRMIVSIYITAAVIPSVPGLGLYQCMSLLGEGNSTAGLEAGAAAMEDILVIALAIAISGYIARLAVRRMQRRRRKQRPNENSGNRL